MHETVPDASMPPPVAVEDIVVSYGERIILNHVTATFNAGEIRVILGTSGCGKTTLLKTIIGLIRPRGGQVRLFGRELGDPDEPATAQQLKKAGVLFQNGALLGSLSIADNVALPLIMHTRLPRKLIREIVQLKLTQVNLPHAAKLYPSELSGGMRKRAALARALALDPPLLLCDEPSAGLDPVTSAGLDELLLTLRESLGITVIVVTHELFSIEKIADSTIFLHKGSVLFDGPLSGARAIDTGPVHDFFSRTEPTDVSPAVAGASFTLESAT